MRRSDLDLLEPLSVFVNQVMSVAWIALAIGCSARDASTTELPGKTDRKSNAHDAGGLVAPGLRLPEGVVPLAYDLRLEVDPDRDTFAGHVEIRAKLAKPTNVIWLHGDELELVRGTVQGTPVTFAAVAGAQEMHALQLADQVAGEVTIALDYAGHVGNDLEGLFRQKFGTKWFLYSQAEATYARRIVPCFDEPKFKVPWRVTLVVPVGQVALANAPIESEQTIGKQREVRFAEMRSLPAHLLAIAVGPFTLVDVGKVGRDRVPVRLAVAPSHAKRVAAAATWVPKLVDALEAYFDQPLPLAKLDLVAVPRFFGAMENPGLITFETTALVGDDKDPVFLRRHIRFVSHELAHQWLGNAVTPAWWNDLWLAEAFATWLDDKLSSALGPLDDAALRTQLARAHALEADRDVRAKPIRRAIASNDDIEDAFDAISYEKGAAVIAMFEDYVGADKFRDVVRTYSKHAPTADAEDFIAAFPDAALGNAFAGFLDHPGAPVVDVAVDCKRGVTATPRDKTSVPVCMRHPGGKTCKLATGATTMLAGCPAWLVANAEGRGYYHVHWTTPVGAAPLTPAERLASGEDLAAAFVRGELKDAPAEIDALLGMRDPYAELAAIALAKEVDHATTDRAPWELRLATAFQKRLARGAIWEAKLAMDVAVRDAMTEMIPAERFPKDTVQRGRELVDRVLRDGPMTVRSNDLVVAIALAAPSGGKALFERIVATATKNTAFIDEWFEGLGQFDATFAPRAVELVFDDRFEPDRSWPAIGGMLARPHTRVAAWKAVKPNIARLVSTLGEDARLVVEATAGLCDQTSRDEVAAALAPLVNSILDGKQKLAESLAAIDRCIKTVHGP